jgi:mono/diheme cytochrome c family protein
MNARHCAIALLLTAAACGGDKSRAPATTPPPGPGSPAAATADTSKAPAAGQQAAVSGAAVFGRTCQTCHQANGNGMPGTFPPLAGSDIAAGDKTMLIKLVLHGLQGPITVKGQRYNNVMPPWQSLSDGELAAVLSYVRHSFGNNAPAVTAEDVARERAATSSRTTPWTIGELMPGR